MLNYVQSRISEVEFATWFSNVKLLGVTNGELLLGVRNSFAQEWFRSHYLELMENALRSLGAQNPRVAFQILSAVQEPMLPLLEPPPRERQDRQDGSESRDSRDSRDSSFSRDSRDSRLSSPRISPEETFSPTQNLNPKYTFDNFVVGENNKMSHAASLRVAEAPGKTYNPLFIYGDVGLGKTHLMHAVGHHVRRQNPTARIEYVSTETFTNELINSIREDRMIEFRNRYRSIDVLLVDDIQFLAGKERTQEEFFHTFNALYENHKQIILSSDRPPRDIQTLEARLRSRFEWGLITDIQTPDFETRVAILKMNAQNRRINISQDVLEMIARQITSNIRELEGALMRVVAYTSLNTVEFSRTAVVKALSDVFSDTPLQIEMADVLQLVATHFKVTEEAIKGTGRSREIAMPRQAAMYLIREMTNHSLSEIGVFFGRDHSTVLHAVQKVGEQVLRDSALDISIKEIRVQAQSLG